MKIHIWIGVQLAITGCLMFTSRSYGQNPEFSLREFASGQIKKGVRSIGMGGDGATWGNYSLVWRDSSTALLDAGVTAADIDLICVGLLPHSASGTGGGRAACS